MLRMAENSKIAGLLAIYHHLFILFIFVNIEIFGRYSYLRFDIHDLLHEWLTAGLNG